MTNIFAGKAIIIALGCATAVTPLAAASAKGADGARTTEVGYRDLDLATQQGVDRLHMRVRNAASAVCAQPGVRDVKTQGEVSACRKMAMAHAAARIEFAIAEARNGREYAVREAKLPVTAH